MRIKTFRFFNDTWKFETVVRLGGKRKSAAAYHGWLVQGRPAVARNSRVSGATFLTRGEKGVFIWFPEVPTAGTVAHEAMHAAAHVLRESGLGPMTEETEEAYTYLTHWLVDQITERVAGAK